MSILLFSVLIPLCLVIGIGASAIGVTAWMILVPVLFVLFGFNIYVTLFTSLVVDCGNALIMTVYAHQNNQLDLKTGLKLTLVSSVIVLLGIYLGTAFIPENENMFKAPAVLVNIFFGLVFIRRGYKLGKQEEMGSLPIRERPSSFTLRAGLVYAAVIYVGFQTGLLGIGGGMMYAMSLMFFLSFSPLMATGTAMLISMLTTIIAATGIFFQIPIENCINRQGFILILTMVFFSMIGTILGARIAYSLSMKKLNYLIAGVIILAAVISFAQNLIVGY